MARSKGRTGRPWERRRAQVIDAAVVCAWCKQPIDKTLPGTHPRGPTVDHTIELCLDGDPLDWSNLSAMHKECNEEKERQRRRRARNNPSRRW